MKARSLATALAAAAGSRLLYRELTQRPLSGDKAWIRTNHRGEQVSLLEGPALAAAAAAAALVLPGLDYRDRMAAALAGAGAGAVGRYDDLADDSDRRGFRGHLGALARGEVTSGTVKIAAIGGTSLAAALLLSKPGRSGRVADVVINAGLIAGMANLVNLFDLRPGRAIKVSLLIGTLIGATGPSARAAIAAPVGAAAGLLAEDLGEQSMLGDAGANALGAMLGTAAAATLPRPARLALLTAVAGLTAASEKISFTRVIEGTPALRRLDEFGRRAHP
jgi:UDP-GlcNAc:undecaprenyl-phosphate/decaprenyl-phosphate GlcNAc-1-phosphate transferase